jgi:menaquinone-dependent protoporphyrinogen oxidase
MRVLVVHASQFGATRGIAERIATILGRAGFDVNERVATDPTPVEGFGAVVIGSAVHAGHWLDDATRFVYRNEAELRTAPVWLFSSGPLGDRAVAAPQPDPKEVATFRAMLRPRGHVVFAGAFDRETADFSDSGLIERTVVRRFLPEGDWRDWNAIDDFAEAIARDLGTPAAAPTRA